MPDAAARLRLLEGRRHRCLALEFQSVRVQREAALPCPNCNDCHVPCGGRQMHRANAPAATAGLPHARIMLHQHAGPRLGLFSKPEQRHVAGAFHPGTGEGGRSSSWGIQAAGGTAWLLAGLGRESCGAAACAAGSCQGSHCAAAAARAYRGTGLTFPACSGSAAQHSRHGGGGAATQQWWAALRLEAT